MILMKWVKQIEIAQNYIHVQNEFIKICRNIQSLELRFSRLFQNVVRTICIIICVKNFNQICNLKKYYKSPTEIETKILKFTIIRNYKNGLSLPTKLFKILSIDLQACISPFNLISSQLKCYFFLLLLNISSPCNASTIH